MASALLRRHSSKQGLQNLLRVTAQRSLEDAEETERERRRRAREAFRQNRSQTSPGGALRDDGLQAEDDLYETELKPSSQSALEEDEGFSDWTQKLEQRRQRRVDEQSQSEDDEGRGLSAVATPTERPLSSATAPLKWRHQQLEDGEEEELGRKETESRRRRKDQEGVAQRQEELWMQREQEKEAERLREEEVRRVTRKREEEQKHVEEKPKEKRKELKVSYTSKVFLQQEVKHVNSNGDAANMEVTSFITAKRFPRSLSQAQEASEEAEVFLETEQKLEKIRRSHQEKESQELEMLRQRQAEAELELEELKKRREERRQLREEEERRRSEEEHHRQVKEEEEKRRMKEDIERRRMEAAERRMKSLSVSSTEGDEPFCSLTPKSPTFKNECEEKVSTEHTCSITERTESLNRSLKKSNSVKKTPPPVLITKMDDRLEQYSHAVETSSKEPKGAKQSAMDIPNPPEPVASKKSLFEAGENWSQNSMRCAPSKDTEGLKVGVADMITQWVKGNQDSSKNSPSKTADVKAGDVLHKKNMWETIGDSSSSARWGPGGKGTPSGKRYKFIVTGHGRYEKIPVSDDHQIEYTNGKPGFMDIFLMSTFAQTAED